MTLFNKTLRAALLAGSAFSVFSAGPVSAEMVGTGDQAVNFFQNAQATGGAMMTVDAEGPVAISDNVELPGFAFAVYDVDFTADSLTMKLVAQLKNLQITQYDDTIFDRYYFTFEQPVTEAKLSDMTDAKFGATVEIIASGANVTSAGAFVEDLPTEFTFGNGGILVTVGEGTDLTKIS